MIYPELSRVSPEFELSVRLSQTLSGDMRGWEYSRHGGEEAAPAGIVREMNS